MAASARGSHVNTKWHQRKKMFAQSSIWLALSVKNEITPQ